MALKHVIKHTDTEIVFKCYMVDGGGGNVDLSLENDMTKTATQSYVVPASVPDETGGGFFEYSGSHVTITGIWWGAPANKKLDITRILSTGPDVVHGHYFLKDNGFYDFTATGGTFADRVYANKDIRLAFDGPGHCIIRLRKAGWATKVRYAELGSEGEPT